MNWTNKLTNITPAKQAIIVMNDHNVCIIKACEAYRSSLFTLTFSSALVCERISCGY